MNNRRIQIRLPGDWVLLVIDDHKEMGILSVEKDVIPPTHYYDCGDDDGANVDNNGYTLGHDPSVNMCASASASATFDNEETMFSPLMANNKRERSFAQVPISSELSTKTKTQIQTQKNTPSIASLQSQSQSHSQQGGRNDNKLPELNYVLTVDQDLYKRVLSEMLDSRTPCGLYFFCHDDGHKNVHINVAIGILFVVFSLIFWGTCVWPT